MSGVRSNGDSFFWSVAIFQVFMLVLTGLWLDYGEDTAGDLGPSEVELGRFYPMYQDVHVMIFVGFGFLMTFLRRYGYSAVGYNLVLAVLCLQWGIILQNFMRQLFTNPLDSKFFDRFQDITLDVAKLIEGDFAAATALISFGAVIGKTTPTQLVWMIFLEMFWYTVNEQILVHQFKVSDPGGSMVIHTFGAFFGLTVSYFITPRSMTASNQDDDNRPVYHSDIFSMIGSVFLWMYWPSFNAALVPAAGNSQHRAVVNTLYSLCGSASAAFAVSKLYRGSLEMVDVQNAVLAGGVAMGASCALSIGIWGALLTGIVAGTVSTLGFAIVTPFMWQRLGVHDTCGVLSLHGMPGVLGGLASAVAAVTVDDTKYGTALNDVWYGRADGRSSGRQGAFQVAGTVTTVAMALFGGIVTGLLLKSPLFAKPKRFFNDSEFWATPEEEVPQYFSKKTDGRASVELAKQSSQLPDV